MREKIKELFITDIPLCGEFDPISPIIPIIIAVSIVVGLIFVR